MLSRLNHLDLDPLNSSEGDDIAGERFGDLSTGKPLESEELRYSGTLDLFVWSAPWITIGEEGYRVAHTHLPLLDPSNCDPPDVGRVVEGGDEHLEGASRIAGGSRDPREDRLEEWIEIGPLLA
jgi:hypothetical protein